MTQQFPAPEDRPCYDDPQNSCHRDQSECICYQESMARIKATKQRVLSGFIGGVFAATAWFTWVNFWH